MALRPEDVIGPIPKATIKKHEDVIDRALLEEIGAEGNISINYDVARTPRRIVNELVRLYTAAGWDVHYVNDVRDGDYLRFRMPR